MRRGQDETSYIISCDTAWTFNRRGYCASFLFAVFSFEETMSNRNPTEHEVFRLLKEELSSLAAEVFLPFRWRLTTKKKDRKKTVEEGMNESTAATGNPSTIPPQGPLASPFTRPRFLKQSRTTLAFYSSFQVSNLWLVHTTTRSCRCRYFNTIKDCWWKEA